MGSPSAPPPSMDLSSMTDMVTELSRPVDRAQLDQEIEAFNLTYPVNVDDAVNLFSLPPVAGTGTTRHHCHPNPNTPRHHHHHHQPTAPRYVHPITSCHHRPIAPPHRSPQRRCRDKDHHLDGDDSQWTSQNRRQTTATTSPGALSPLARFFPSPVG